MLLLEMSIVHPVFHVSMLRKFVGDSSSIVLLEDMSVEEYLTYKKVLSKILDRLVKKLRNKEVLSNKGI